MIRLQFGLVVLALLVTGLLNRNLGHGQPMELKTPLDRFPSRIGEWESVNVVFDDEIEDRLGTSDYVYRVYSDAKGAIVHLYVGYYPSQEHGQMIHSPKNCLPGNGWYIASKGSAILRLPPFDAFQVNDFLVANGSHEQVVLYWYQQAGGRVVTNEYLGRVFLVVDAIRTNRTDAALIRINMPVITTTEESLQAGIRFLQSAYPILMEEFLPHDRDRTEVLAGTSGHASPRIGLPFARSSLPLPAPAPSLGGRWDRLDNHLFEGSRPQSGP